MTIAQAVETIREALTLALFTSMPILLAGLVVGLFVSVLQAVTQIQEQTLSFVPKIIGMGVVAMLAVPWIVIRVMEFAREMFGTL